MPTIKDRSIELPITMSVHDNSSETMSKGSYKPVIIVHGLMTGDVSTMEHLATRITELHPGTKTYVIDRFCGLASLEPMWRQTKQLADDLLRICSLHPEGVHVIGYSQGGLIARGMLETYGDKHNVRTFVSLSSPQGGQFGAKCFTRMFPALTARTAYEVFYTRLGQHALSIANYWYDPRHRDLYLKYSVYLAVIDNIKPKEFRIGSSKQQKAILTIDVSETTSNSTNSQVNDNITKSMETRVSAAIAAVSAASIKVAEGHADDNNGDDTIITTSASINAIMANVSANDADCYYYEDDDNSSVNANTRKLGLTRLQRLVLIGGPDDGVISPWQSSQFAILDSTGGLVPMRERQQDVYGVDDPIGLQQLDMTGRIIEYTVPGVDHHKWHCNERVLHECIIGWLD